MKKRNLTVGTFLLFLGVLHLLCASLSWAAGPTLESAWKFGLSGNNAQSPQSSSQFVSFGLDSKTKYWMEQSLFLNFEALLKFENGSYQSVDGARKNESGIYLKEAGAHWLPADSLLLSAGALNQVDLHNDLLFGAQAFPALRARWRWLRWGLSSASLDLEQATPTSSSLSTGTTEAEPTPGFSSASLAFQYETGAYYWKTRAGLYRFTHLPASVAYQSGLRGNTVTALAPNEAAFAYEQEGVDAQTSLRFRMARGWDFLGGAAYLQNTKAPAGSRQAYSLNLGSEFFLVGQKSLELSWSGFRIESDAAVAAFSSSKFFYTNRQGYNVESYLNFRKHKFRVGLAYTDAEVIYLNPVQNREKSLMFLLETFYANI